MTHSPLANGIQLTSDSDSRNGRAVDRFIVHHAATTSLAAILALFAPGGREVSANYALGSDGTLILAVDEDRSAWTSASWYDDRAITIEVANSEAGGSWPVSDAAFDKLARLIADWSLRYGVPITDDTVLTHQELYQRFGESYATACPGDLERRKGELLALANRYRSHGAAPAPSQNGNDVFDADAQKYLQGIKDEVLSGVRREGRGRLYYCETPPAGLPQYVVIFWDRTPGDDNILYCNEGEVQADHLRSLYYQTADTTAQARAAALSPAQYQVLIDLAKGVDSAFTNRLATPAK